MTFTYAGDPANSNLEWVRFELGDTVSTSEIFSDEEINAVLGEQSNKYLAAARLWSNLGTRWATLGKGRRSKTVSRLRIEYGNDEDVREAIHDRIAELRFLGMPTDKSRVFRVMV